jgi:hypothetical protein
MGVVAMPRRVWCLVVVVLVSWLIARASAAEPASSLHLVVQTQRARVVAGHAVRVTIALQDAHDQPAPAPAAFVIALAMTPPIAGAPATVTIPAGQPAVTLELRPSKLGLLGIRATHPQAFEGDAYIRVTRTTSSNHAAAGDSKAPDPAKPDAGKPGAAKPHMAPIRGDDGAGGGAPPPAHALPPALAPPPIVAGATLPHLELRYSPQRKLLADGQDAVTIHAFLSGGDTESSEPADGLFKVTLFASSGTLQPRPLVIQDGEGSATLTTDRPGDVTVEFVSAQPGLALAGEGSLHIHFGAPVHAMRLEAKPAKISLVDDTEFVVTLIDAAGRPVATDEPLTIQLALDRGHGEIEQTALRLQPGEFEKRSRFSATGIGEVAISAASASLLDQTARLDVQLPLGLLALSVIGGLVGGVLAYYRRHSRWTRIAVGSVTGFLLYWAFIFGLVRVLPAGAVLNPLSNFALSAIGGWLGTGVFSHLLRWLGIKKPAVRDAAKSDAAKSDAAKSDAAKSDAAKSDASPDAPATDGKHDAAA